MKNILPLTYYPLFSLCLQADFNDWLSLVDHLKIKAFPELTLASSLREGVNHLESISLCSPLGRSIPVSSILMMNNVMGHYSDYESVTNTYHGENSYTNRYSQQEGMIWL